MSDSTNTPTMPETEALTLLKAGDVLADARYFVICAEMAVVTFGPTDDRVAAIQSATMAAIEKIRLVEAYLDKIRKRMRKAVQS